MRTDIDRTIPIYIYGSYAPVFGDGIGVTFPSLSLFGVLGGSHSLRNVSSRVFPSAMIYFSKAPFRS